MRRRKIMILLHKSVTFLYHWRCPTIAFFRKQKAVCLTQTPLAPHNRCFSLKLTFSFVAFCCVAIAEQYTLVSSEFAQTVTLKSATPTRNGNNVTFSLGGNSWKITRRSPYQKADVCHFRSSFSVMTI